MTRYGIVLDTVNAPDIQKKQRLSGDMGKIVWGTLASLGVSSDDVTVVYAIPTLMPATKRASAWKPEAERVREELLAARVEKVLCLGPVAAATVMGLHKAPSINHFRGRYQRIEWSDGSAGHPVLLPVISSYSIQSVWGDTDLYRDLARDIIKFVGMDGPAEQPTIQVEMASTNEQVEAFLARASVASVQGWDVETTGLDPRTERLESIGIAALTGPNSGHALIIPREMLYAENGGGFMAVERLKNMMRVYCGAQSPFAGKMVWHNIKFDLQHMRSWMGEWIEHPGMADTMMMSYAQDERPAGRYAIHGLKDLSRMRYDAPDFKFDWNTWYATPLAERDYTSLYQYHALDCYYTARLYKDLEAELRDEDPKLLALCEDVLVPASRVLAEVEYTGVQMDEAHFADMGRRLEAELADSERRLVAMAVASGKEGLNPNAPNQVSAWLFDHMDVPSATRSTEKEELVKLARAYAGQPVGEFITLLLEHRDTAKTLKTYVRSLLAKKDAEGRIHPDFFLAGTATGRLSCTNPNLQNVPSRTRRGKEVRDGFVSKPGWTFVEADYRNLELRIAAWYSLEPMLVEAFGNDEDLHKKVASDVFRKPVDDITDGERSLTKAVNFGIIYGRGAQALATGREMDDYEAKGGTRWTVQEAQEFINDYMRKLPLLALWMDEIKAEARKTQRVGTPMGRRRRFPLILGHMRGEIDRQAVNTPVQSFASDLCLSALVRISRRLGAELPGSARVILTIHDSIMVECRTEVMARAAAIIREEMVDNAPCEKRVKLSIDMKVGTRWGSTEKWDFGAAIAGLERKAA